MRILVVDDDTSIQKIATRCLTDRGHQVSCLGDGAEAVNWIEDNIVDVVVADYNLPGVNGLEILARVRKLYPASARLMMSGALDLHSTMEAVNRGEVARVLQKPFTGADLVSSVEAAVGSLKQVGEHYVRSSASDRTQVAADLEECFQSNLLRLAVQPIFDAQTRACFGYEALLRSRHEVLRGPLEVLEAAEMHGRIEKLSREMCKLGAQWFQAFDNDEHLFLNLHPAELENPTSLLERFAVLQDFSERIIIEITERGSVKDLSSLRTSIRGLREMGFGIALDDLGAGYSSLSMLAELKPRYIKIDMSLIRDIHLDLHRQHVVRLVCNLARTLDSRVVAEGIENEEELATSIACGAHLLQGYYLGRPSDNLWKP